MNPELHDVPAQRLRRVVDDDRPVNRPPLALAQGVCLAGLFLAGGCRFDDFYRFFAMIPVVIEGVVEGIKPFEWDHGEQGIS